jgi:hypothetical protein
MQHVPMNYLAVVVAAVAGFAVGAVWYMALGKVWMQALGKKKEDMNPSPMPFIISAVALLVMAWMLAGVMGHLGQVTVRGGVITGAFLWLGFVLTTTGVNQAFEGMKPMLTAIDVGHWLAVLVVMGAVIGAFGS